MDNKKLQNLVERITRDLLKEWEVKRKKVLFIFCDSSAHEVFTDQLIQLTNRGIDHDLLFLDGETSAWLGLHQIESTGSKRILAADEYAKAPIELPRDYDAVVVPEIDLDNAARVCHGLKGSVKAEIIFSALVSGLPVIIGDDSPGIKRSDRRALKCTHLPEPYRLRFEKYKQELKELGVYFSNQIQLDETIANLWGRVSNTESASFSDRVLTIEWLMKHPGDVLTVSSDTIITPLAKDFLKERGIKLLKR